MGAKTRSHCVQHLLAIWQQYRPATSEVQRELLEVSVRERSMSRICLNRATGRLRGKAIVILTVKDVTKCGRGGLSARGGGVEPTSGQEALTSV